MRIGVTSQNFRTITGHAGKTRRFIIYEAKAGESAHEVERLDLPLDQSLHAVGSAPHPIDQLDVLITAGCGQGFEKKMAQRNIQLVKTAESDPSRAVSAVLQGKPLQEPRTDDHRDACH